MPVRSILALALLGSSLAAAACGEETERAPGSGSGGSRVQVEMKDLEFVPRDVTVRRGGTVTWTNRDATPHTVTKRDGPGPRFDSATVDAREVYERRFDVPGRIGYICSIHTKQTGTITVR